MPSSMWKNLSEHQRLHKTSFCKEVRMPTDLKGTVQFPSEELSYLPMQRSDGNAILKWDLKTKSSTKYSIDNKLILMFMKSRHQVSLLRCPGFSRNAKYAIYLSCSSPSNHPLPQALPWECIWWLSQWCFFGTIFQCQSCSSCLVFIIISKPDLENIKKFSGMNSQWNFEPLRNSYSEINKAYWTECWHQMNTWLKKWLLLFALIFRKREP